MIITDMAAALPALAELSPHQLEAMACARCGRHLPRTAPLIQRRRDGLVLRTADVIPVNGFRPNEELWALDGGATARRATTRYPTATDAAVQRLPLPFLMRVGAAVLRR